MVVQRLCSFQPERRVVPRWALPQPLPGRGLLGRVQRRSLFSEESDHDDTTQCKHLPLTLQLLKTEHILTDKHFRQMNSISISQKQTSLNFSLRFFFLSVALLYIHNEASNCKGSCSDSIGSVQNFFFILFLLQV